MKVLHIGKYSPPFFGGIENFMMDLGEACSEQGVCVAAIVHHHQPWQTFDKRQISGVTVYRVPTCGKLMFAPLSPNFGYHLNRVIDEFKPDILHIHMPNTAAFFALFSAKAKKLPWVVHWHSDVLGENSPWFLQAFYPFYRPLESLVTKKANKIIATSPPYLQSSIALKGLKDKAEVISLGVKTEHKEVVQKQKAKVIRLLIVGRLTYYKGHKYLLEALSLLKSQGVVAFELNIVGGGELESKICSIIYRLGLTEQVSVLGNVSFEQLKYQFATADCLCLPSIERTEAFGVVLMEAASYGLPSIVTDVPGSGMSWAVLHNETGLVVKRADSNALADAITTLYCDPTRRKLLAVAAKARFDSHFKINGVAQQTISLYQSILSKK